MSNEQQLPVQFRDMAAEDNAFVYNSWLKSFRNGTMNRNVDNSIYFHNHHKLIDKILQRSTIVVCCDAKDPKIIFGYVVYEKIDGQFVLHYIYVKNIYRKLGIAKKLLEQCKHDFSVLGCYTHQTQVAVAKEEKYNLLYHPYLLIQKV